VDIGAADGYYAAGLARACPDGTVYAYEMNPLPARVCRRLAEANGVSGRLVMRGECRVADLLELPDTETFVLCDCEGAEAELIDPARVPLLRRSDLIVELHEWAAPGIRQRIEERFRATHTIEIVASEPRYVADYPALLDVPVATYMDREVGLSEYRPAPMAWAVLTRLSRRQPDPKA
jgi:predicted O-methyltransferase YrrM